MNFLDVLFLASMSTLVVFFAAVAVAEWRQARHSHQGADAEVIWHTADDRSDHLAA